MYTAVNNCLVFHWIICSFRTVTSHWSSIKRGNLSTFALLAFLTRLPSHVPSNVFYLKWYLGTPSFSNSLKPTLQLPSPQIKEIRGTKLSPKCLMLILMLHWQCLGFVMFWQQECQVCETTEFRLTNLSLFRMTQSSDSTQINPCAFSACNVELHPKAHAPSKTVGNQHFQLLSQSIKDLRSTNLCHKRTMLMYWRLMLMY